MDGCACTAGAPAAHDHLHCARIEMRAGCGVVDAAMGSTAKSDHNPSGTFQPSPTPPPKSDTPSARARRGGCATNARRCLAGRSDASPVRPKSDARVGSIRGVSPQCDDCTIPPSPAAGVQLHHLWAPRLKRGPCARSAFARKNAKRPQRAARASRGAGRGERPPWRPAGARRRWALRQPQPRRSKKRVIMELTSLV